MDNQKSGIKRFTMLALSNVVAVTGLLGIAVYFFLDIDNDELLLRSDALASVGQYGKTDPYRTSRVSTPDYARITPRAETGTYVDTDAVMPAIVPVSVNTAAKTDALIKFTREVVVKRITPDSSFDLASVVPGKPYPMESPGVQLPLASAPSKDSKIETVEDAAPVKSAPETKRQKKNRLMLAKLKHKAREQYCLAAAVYYESAFEPTRGKQAVAQVVLNRKASKNYPNTVCGVVFQNDHMKNRCQFSFACDGRSDRPKKTKPWHAAEKVAKDFLTRGKRVRSLAKVTHYHADYVRPKWAKSLTRVSKIGHHIFYSVPKRSKRIRLASNSRRMRNGYRVFKIPSFSSRKKSIRATIIKEYPSD